MIITKLWKLTLLIHDEKHEDVHLQTFLRWIARRRSVESPERDVCVCVCVRARMHALVRVACVHMSDTIFVTGHTFRHT